MANVSANAFESVGLIPAVTWAQRRDKLIITIEVENCQSPIVKFSDDTLYFKGIGGQDKKSYELTMELNGSILPEESIHSVHGRNVVCLLKKTESCASYWPRLLKGVKKAHYLKTNFDQWRDEEDSDDHDDGKDLDFNDCELSNLMHTEDFEADPPDLIDSDDEDQKETP